MTSIGYLPGATRYGVTVVPAAEIARRLRLPTADAAAVAGRRGARGRTRAHQQGGTVTLAMGSAKNDANTGSQSDAKVTDQAGAGRRDSGIGLPAGGRRNASAPVIPTEVATALKLETAPSTLHVYDTRGAITKADQKKVAEQLANSGVNVERGYERPDKWLMLGVLGITGFLLVTVTLISTAPPSRNNRPIWAPPPSGQPRAPVGASPPRRPPPSPLLGGLLGIAIGLVAGVRSPGHRRRDTGTTPENSTVAPTIGIPVTPMLIIVLGVPLIAAGIAAASIRRAPHVTGAATDRSHPSSRERIVQRACPSPGARRTIRSARGGGPHGVRAALAARRNAGRGRDVQHLGTGMVE